MRRAALAVTVMLAAFAGAGGAVSETMSGALIRAYNNSPQINGERAGVRAVDEDVPRAAAGLRPKVSAEAFAGLTARRFSAPGIAPGSEGLRPRSVGVTVEQPLFDGNRARNSVRGAESNVLAARERLRLMEQTVLLSAVTAYMNVLRDAAAYNLQENNVKVLAEQLRQSRERFQEGQITQTDIAQAEARLASGRSQLSLAQANLEASKANYRQVIGVEASRLGPAKPVDHLLPGSVSAAQQIAQKEHPAIASALHGVDVAQIEVRILEGELYPSLSLVGSVGAQADVDARGERQTQASILAKLSVPIYSGGAPSARIRQAKELAGQKTLNLALVRDEVTANMRGAWSARSAIRQQITAAQQQIEAAQRALLGVREEARVGQRTTLDILNAQQELLNARIALIVAQRDLVVASYAVLAAAGRLSARQLSLRVNEYDPVVHFDQVKGRWGGVWTPDGR